jgi:hypothetical protein
MSEIEDNKTYSLEDVLLKNELEGINQLLTNVVKKYGQLDLIGHVDAARIILSTLLKVLPREVKSTPADTETVQPTTDSAGDSTPTEGTAAE